MKKKMAINKYLFTVNVPFSKMSFNGDEQKKWFQYKKKE